MTNDDQAAEQVSDELGDGFDDGGEVANLFGPSDDPLGLDDLEPGILDLETLGLDFDPDAEDDDEGRGVVAGLVADHPRVALVLGVGGAVVAGMLVARWWRRKRALAAGGGGAV